jgi:hypothetical protein
MGEACSKLREEEKYMYLFLWENMKEGDHSKDTNIVASINIKCILKMGLDSL